MAFVWCSFVLLSSVLGLVVRSGLFCVFVVVCCFYVFFFWDFFLLCFFVFVLICFLMAVCYYSGCVFCIVFFVVGWFGVWLVCFGWLFSVRLGLEFVFCWLVYFSRGLVFLRGGVGVVVRCVGFFF